MDRRLGQPPLRGDETRASALLGRCRLSLSTAVTRALTTALGVAPTLSTLAVGSATSAITLVWPTLTITLVRAPLTVSLLVGPTLAPLTARSPATAITLVRPAVSAAGT